MNAARLSVQIKPSPLLGGVLLLAHAAALACAVMFLPGWWSAGAGAALIVASLVFHICRDALQLSGDAVTSLSLDAGGQCEFIMRNGTTLAGRIQGGSFATPLLTVIDVRALAPNRSRSVTLMPGSAPAGELRSVRVWLRHRIPADLPDSGAY